MEGITKSPGGALVGFDKESFFGDVEGVFSNAEFEQHLHRIHAKEQLYSITGVE